MREVDDPDAIVIVAVRGAAGPTTAGWRDCARCGQPCSLGKESLRVIEKHKDADVVQGLGSVLGPRKLKLAPTLTMLALGYPVGIVADEEKS